MDKKKLNTTIMNKKNWFPFATSLLMVFAITAMSCFAQVSGNGKITKEERKVSGFKAISVGNAIHLQIRQGSEEKVTVETDENILPYLKTEVTGGELHIGIKGNVNNASVLNVYVTVKALQELETGSAAQVKSEGNIETDDFKISSGSGSAVQMDLKCTNLKAYVSSGSAVVLEGSANAISAESSSGSSLVASDFKSEKGNVEASSGAVAVIYAAKELKARVSSGANITILGNPSIRDTDSSSGGSVHFK